LPDFHCLKISKKTHCPLNKFSPVPFRIFTFTKQNQKGCMEKKQVGDICRYMEDIAPLAYQENYDNCGLLVGDAAAEVNGILICLDVTEKIIEEAIEQKCNMVVAHHPLIFSGLKKLTGSNYVERTVIKAIKHNIAIYAAHTNLDNMQEGVNAKIAEKIGLHNCRILSPKKDILRKLSTFCPTTHAPGVRKALFEAGAGKIGHYDECSFSTEGIGTFRAGEGAHPYVGKMNEQHSEKEERIEVLFEAYLEKRIIIALLAAHPYEEVAYDILPLGNQHSFVGAGMIGELSEDEDETAFLQRIKTVFKAKSIRHTQFLGKKIKKVAVCGGSGSFLLPDAIKQQADVFITADLKYHGFFDTENRILLADIGHYESEQYTMELFYDLLMKKFSNFAVHLTKLSTNPINYI
jgi:dinuclear metal center YbgI/SA1388 family protein